MSTVESAIPWFKRTLRWGQTNLTEVDPQSYDRSWWRSYWQHTHIQGVIVNAGGIVAYYPSRVAHTHRAQMLGDRDLFGEIAADARAEKLALLARMDTNRVHQPLFEEHPEWIAVNAEGRPYRRGDLYVTCVTGGYYRDFVPELLREIVERYAPDGFTDNSYSGLDRGSICYCRRCADDFRKESGLELPPAVDWSDQRYRRWITWSYKKRVEIWDSNDRVTREAGGKDCRWIGMIGGNILEQCVRLRDLKSICERADILMLDFQRRDVSDGFQSNAMAGMLLHDLVGWDTIIPESTAMYQIGGRGEQTFRLAAKPRSEVRLWAFEGFAGGLQPWWHHVGAHHEDRRQYGTAPDIFSWHEKNEAFLTGRVPIASVGVIWSQENIDFFGRDIPEFEFVLPWRGITHALIRGRIPFMPVHADNIERDSTGITTYVLPNVGLLSDDQCAALTRHVERGGSLVVSGRSADFGSDGSERGENPLDSLLGIRRRHRRHGVTSPKLEEWEAFDGQSYVRIAPEAMAAEAIAPGFEETEIMPFGGSLEVVDALPEATVALTYIPPFPIYPPELAWMRQPNTSIPALLVRRYPSGGRIAYFAGDFDRLYGRFNNPDCYLLLRNVLRWSLSDALPIEVDGPGLIDCHLYRQGRRLLVHLVNLNNEGSWRAPVSEAVAAGPYTLRIKSDMTQANEARLTVCGRTTACRTVAGWRELVVESVLDHELVVLE